MGRTARMRRRQWTARRSGRGVVSRGQYIKRRGHTSPVGCNNLKTIGETTGGTGDEVNENAADRWAIEYPSFVVINAGAWLRSGERSGDRGDFGQDRGPDRRRRRRRGCHGDER